MAVAVVVAVIVTVTAHKNDQLTEFFLYPDSASDFCTADVANLNYNAKQTIY